MSTLYTFWDTIIPYRTESVHIFGGLRTQQPRFEGSGASSWQDAPAGGEEEDEEQAQPKSHGQKRTALVGAVLKFTPLATGSCFMMYKATQAVALSCFGLWRLRFVVLDKDDLYIFEFPLPS